MSPTIPDIQKKCREMYLGPLNEDPKLKGPQRNDLDPFTL